MSAVRSCERAVSYGALVSTRTDPVLNAYFAALIGERLSKPGPDGKRVTVRSLSDESAKTRAGRISYPQINDVHRGNRGVGMSSLAKLAALFGMTIAEASTRSREWATQTNYVPPADEGTVLRIDTHPDWQRASDEALRERVSKDELDDVGAFVPPGPVERLTGGAISHLASAWRTMRATEPAKVVEQSAVPFPVAGTTPDHASGGGKQDLALTGSGNPPPTKSTDGAAGKGTKRRRVRGKA